MDGNLFGCGFVKRTLPPLLEIVDGVGEAFCAEPFGAEIDDGYLLPPCGGECDGIAAGNDVTVVGHHINFQTFAVVVHKETDVSQSVALAQSRSAENGDLLTTL